MRSMSRSMPQLALIGLEEIDLFFELARNGPGRGMIMEIGTFQGGSAMVFALGSKSVGREKVYTVDPHKKYHDNLPESLTPFIQNVQKLGLDDWIIAIVSTSEEVAKIWHEPIRLLFIDALHDYDHVKQDFLLWEPHLVSGGVVALHDSTPSSTDTGPRRVVDEYLRTDKFTGLKTLGYTTWAVKME